MPYDDSTPLWPTTEEHYFHDTEFTSRTQHGYNCVSIALAVLTGEEPEFFQRTINTQDPVSWSEALHPFGMKLAYCPFDVRRLKFYVDELIQLDDLFLLCYYLLADESILSDPDSTGWVCGSHVVILHRDLILDSLIGIPAPANQHSCGEHYTKRIFRVVPVDHQRGV